MAVASGVLAVVVVEDANGVRRRVVIYTETRCDLRLVDRLLRLRQTARSYGATLRLEQVHPALIELLDLVGVCSRFRVECFEVYRSPRNTRQDRGDDPY